LDKTKDEQKHLTTASESEQTLWFTGGRPASDVSKTEGPELRYMVSYLKLKQV